NPEKVTTPGMKKLYRIINTINHHSEGDYIALESEKPNEEERLKMFHPVHTYISKYVTNFQAVDLHHDIFINGELIYASPSLNEMQAYATSQLNLLWDEFNRTNNPEEYAVDLSQKTWDNKMADIIDVREKVREMAERGWQAKYSAKKMQHTIQDYSTVD